MAKYDTEKCLKLVHELIISKQTLFNHEWEAKYLDLDDHFTSYLEHKYGCTDLVIEKAQNYLYSMIHNSGNDIRLAWFWSLLELPFSKILFAEQKVSGKYEVFKLVCKYLEIMYILGCANL